VLGVVTAVVTLGAMSLVHEGAMGVEALEELLGAGTVVLDDASTGLGDAGGEGEGDSGHFLEKLSYRGVTEESGWFGGRCTRRDLASL
jgi:hypothetical protein